MGDATRTSPILLAPPRSVSPSLAELLRLCPLRAILARSRGTEPFVLGSPKAWLGTAYHRVMEGAAFTPRPSGPSAAGRTLWDRAIEKLWQEAKDHPLNRRFGAPETWPGYHLALAGATLHFEETASGPQPHASSRATCHAGQSMRERRLTAMEGRLVGRPDRVTRREVVEYKSGNIYEDRATTEVKAGYVRQLRLYGYLVHHNYGYWPERGVLRPMLGQRVEIDLMPSACESEAVEAVSLLEAANAELCASDGATCLASPSSLSCGYCPYKIICPAFWQAAKPEWAGDLRQVCVEGPLIAPPSAVHGGEAASAEVDVLRGTWLRQPTVIAPLNKHIHPCLAGGWARGTHVRFTGLTLRRDGRPSPCAFTVCAAVQDLPELRVPALDANPSTMPRDRA